MRIMRIVEVGGMKFKEIEKLLFNDGWLFKTAKGSHYQYIHPSKPGKVTVPYHKGDLDLRTVKSILRQAGLQ
jgi:predicted RNA binding protein YcfA (HicA-like mRNA interferase family)